MLRLQLRFNFRCLGFINPLHLKITIHNVHAPALMITRLIHQNMRRRHLTKLQVSANIDIRTMAWHNNILRHFSPICWPICNVILRPLANELIGIHTFGRIHNQTRKIGWQFAISLRIFLNFLAEYFEVYIAFYSNGFRTSRMPTKKICGHKT